MAKSFPVYRQLDQMDCGPTCLKMISQFYGKSYSLQTLRNNSYITREGVSLKGISEAASKLGFHTLGAKLNFDQLDSEATLPCILHWNQNHFVVLPPQDYDKNKNNKITIVDPAHGIVKITKEAFLKAWISTDDNFGVALLLEPTPDFYKGDDEKEVSGNLAFLFNYLKPYKKYIIQLLIGMLIGSVFSLVAPFLTQSLVDYGINQRNINFIQIILAAQLSLFFGNTAIEVLRNWLLLHITTRVNISIISDFLIKLMKLPIRFFDTKMIGDITQRISDHKRIEEFLTGASLNTIFSIINLIIFSVVLGIYSLQILTFFVIGSAISIAWVFFFLKKRRELNYIRFQRMTDNQNSLLEIISGMQDIKVNDSEETHRWAWEKVQARLFKINMDSLRLSQYQNMGSKFFNQLKNILTTFIAANEVINGNITIGMMLSVSYIIGLMNSPIEQLIGFFQNAQDAKISLERLREIHTHENEEKDNQLTPNDELFDDDSSIIPYSQSFGKPKGIILDDVSFQFGGPTSPFVLKDISLCIPFGKVTAIVGASGSGKTTLMKIILKFYEPTRGRIHLDSLELQNISAKWWRKHCGIVMSDGFIFSNTIARNISVNENIDYKRVFESAKIANVYQFVNKLPLGFSTKIGNTGNGISSGQRQRILIARAVYKQPKFIFLDEATSTLDANNEKVIIKNLEEFFENKTVLVIAHRLSTVKHADQIVVMESGRIVEIGNHNSLVEKRGYYYELVKNQLELGN